MATDFDISALFEPDDLRRIQDKLARFTTPSEFHRRSLKAAGLRLLELVRRGFAQGGVDPQSGAPRFWPATVRGNKPLHGTGRLMGSINLQVRGSGMGMEALVGTNVGYAKYHEQPGNDKGFIEYATTPKQRAFLFFKFGWRLRKDKKIRLPQRRMFVMPEPWRVKVAQAYREVLLEQLGG